MKRSSLLTAMPGTPMTNGRFEAAVFAAIGLAWGLWLLQAPLVRNKGD